MQPFYRTILKRSWEITKKFKSLWLLGFFAAFLGNGGELSFFFDFTGTLGDQPSIWQNLKNYLYPIEFSGLASLVANAALIDKLIFLIFLVFTLALVIFIIWLVVSAQAGLINAVNEIDQREQGGFLYNFQIGHKFFGSALLLNILTKFISFIIITVIITPIIVLLIVQNSKLATLFIVLGFLVLLPAVIILNFIGKYALAYLILEGKKFWQAFLGGWKLFLANWLISLEMAVILLLINIILGFLFIIASLIIISPFIVFFFISQNISVFYLFFPLAMILIFIMMALIGSGYAAFHYSSWVLLFNKLTKEKLYSKLERLTIYGQPENLKAGKL